FFLCLLGGLVLGLSSCEVEDDGVFTPPVIFVDDTTPIDPSYTIEDPCLTSSCALQSMTLDGGSADLTMEMYASYDILREDAIWGAIKGAIIVVHGNERNANEYFNWMANAVLAMNKQDEVVFIAPHFKTSDDVGNNSDLVFWSSNGWKRGFESGNITSNKIASYEVVDSLIQLLADKSHFPFMENIIVTGHSAGAQFTGLYAAANPVEDTLDGIEVNYVVANSQYFFYPGAERFDAGSNQFVIPQGCNNYTNWPYGTDAPTTYLSQFTEADIRNRYVNRKVTYLAGSLDISTGGLLNTSDCAAVLLGENRFVRSENMLKYLDAFHSGHPHSRKVVNNVAHNASQMYNSTVGVGVLRDILGD
ncbi:MAG: hypothetical protein AB8B69_26105, partial [Chitinophagales bacterium]